MVKVTGGARSDSKRLVWGQQTKCPRVEFQVAGVAVETQACVMETQRFKTSSTKLRNFKTSSTKLRNWLERKQAGFTFISLWRFPGHHRDNVK